MNKNGVALVFALLLMSVILILGGAAFNYSLSESFLSQNFVKNTRAFWLAEAGVQKAARALNDGTTAGWSSLPPSGYSLTENLGGGSYTVQLTCTSCTNPIATSVGTVGNVQRTVVVRFQTESILTYAALAKGQLTMSGNGKTDSYDSSIGAYNANVGGHINKGSDGDVATDGTTNGIINLSANAIVNGDASTGPGGTVSISDNAHVNGTTTSNNAINIPDIQVPECLTGLAGSGNYAVGGNTNATLGSGNYRYSSLNIDGNGKLTITGTVKIYLTSSSALNISGNGKLLISGTGNLMIYTDGVCNIAGNGIVNSTTVPNNLILRSTYSGANGVNITGNGDLKGIVYSPNTDIINSGNGSIYGCVVGKTVNISGNGDIHYDQTLTNTPGFSSFGIQNWSDENTPYPLP